jgi:hypothetical protein
MKPYVKVVSCVIHSLLLLGYEHLIPYTRAWVRGREMTTEIGEEEEVLCV